MSPSSKTKFSDIDPIYNVGKFWIVWSRSDYKREYVVYSDDSQVLFHEIGLTTPDFCSINDFLVRADFPGGRSQAIFLRNLLGGYQYEKVFLFSSFCNIFFDDRLFD
jgi:hypothetical protein